MNTECANCDRHAVAYWGPIAYCKDCISKEKRTHPQAHTCCSCNEQQPTYVSWHRRAPCGKCQAKEAT